MDRELVERFKDEFSRTVATACVEVSLLSLNKTHVFCDYGTDIRVHEQSGRINTRRRQEGP